MRKEKTEARIAKQGIRTSMAIPKRGDRGEIGGGGYDGERDESKNELTETQSKPARGSRHALNVLHPPPGHIMSGQGRSLHRMNRWPAHVHYREILHRPHICQNEKFFETLKGYCAIELSQGKFM